MLEKLKKNKKLVEIAVVIVFTIIAAFLSFFNLGNTVAPQTEYVSPNNNIKVNFAAGEELPDTFLFYPGIQNSDSRRTISISGTIGTHNKTIVSQSTFDNGYMYRWNRISLAAKYNYAKIEFSGTGTLYGIKVYDINGYEVSAENCEIEGISASLEGFSAQSPKTWSDGDYVIIKTQIKEQLSGSGSYSYTPYAMQGITFECEGATGASIAVNLTDNKKDGIVVSTTQIGAKQAYFVNARAYYDNISITLSRSANIIEVGFLRDNQHVLMQLKSSSAQGTEALYDEQDLFPDRTEYSSGMIFDEIYFGRTAYEFITESGNVYEWTHPHLGKILLSLGIQWFGMTPFGWRFMSALFSTFIVPLSYALGRIILKRFRYATLFTLLMTIEGIRLVQGRIGTVDSFLVFFILASYLFMFLFYKYSRGNRPAWKWLLPLAAAGALFGCAASVKWSGVYAGVGLFIIFVAVIVRTIYYHNKRVKSLDKVAEKSAISSLRKRTTFKVFSCIVTAFVFFIVLTIITYVAAYVPHAICDDITDIDVLKTTWEIFTLNLPQGEWNHLGTALNIANADKSEFTRLVLRVTGNIFEYHSDLDATHYYSSSWYTWPFGYKPVFFSYGDVEWDGMFARIYTGGVFAVWIGGFVSVMYFLGTFIYDKIKGRQTPETKRRNRLAFFVAIGIIANYVPWIFISRCTFIYHYYPTVPFVLMFVPLALDDIGERWAGKRVKVFEKKELTLSLQSYIAAVFVLLCVVNFVIMYPMLAGLPISRELANILYGWTGAL